MTAVPPHAKRLSTNRLWARAVVVHPLSAAAALFVLQLVSMNVWEDAFSFVAVAVVAAAVITTAVMAMRDPAATARECWSLVITGFVCTVFACLLTLAVAVILQLAWLCEYTDRCLQ